MKNDTLGERVKALRKKAGITQIDLAYRVYVSESYIALIEADKRNPSVDVINSIAEVFHVSVDYLMNGEESESEKRMFREWRSLMQGRSEKEIKTAVRIVKELFECFDENKKK